VAERRAHLLARLLDLLEDEVRAGLALRVVDGDELRLEVDVGRDPCGEQRV
jgi:hypothetical protein